MFYFSIVLGVQVCRRPVQAAREEDCQEKFRKGIEGETLRRRRDREDQPDDRIHQVAVGQETPDHQNVSFNFLNVESIDLLSCLYNLCKN